MNGLPVFLLFISLQINGQICTPANTPSYAWPNHQMWFFGNGVIGDFTNGAPTFSSLPVLDVFDPPISYEGTAAVSNEKGDLLWVSNGIRVWDVDGVNVHDGFSTGNEGDKMTGSAVQGVFITRHQLNPKVYHVFCTDDVLSGGLGVDGLDHYTVNDKGQIINGPTTIQSGRTFEGISATKHGNGVDIWVVAQDFATGYYNAYLIDCNGLNIGASILNQDMGIKFINWQYNLNKDMTRGALEFSWDGKKMGQGHPASWPVGYQEASTFDFDNLTGILSNPINFSSIQKNIIIYDIEFSADNSRLYFTTKESRVGYYDISSDDSLTIHESFTYIDSLTKGNSSQGAEASIEMGADGKMYINNVKESDLFVINGDKLDPIDVGADISGTIGLPNMYIPPADSVKIQTPVGANDCSPINIETIWKCKNTSAENTIRYEDAYSLATTGAYVCPTCVIDSKTGALTVPSPGTYEVHFEICELRDTLVFNVTSCTCDARVGDAAPICPGEKFNLDNIIEGASSKGIWTIDSFPLGSGVDALIDDKGVDTLFDASNLKTKPGIYKIMFRVDDTCEDSVYIEVKTLPTVYITEIGPFCDDSVKTNVLAIPVLGGDVTNATWQYENFPSIPANVPYDFDPSIAGAGVHRIKYIVDSLGCSGEDSIKVLVKERPHPEIKPAGPFCSDVDMYQLELVDAALDTGVWSGKADADGKFYPVTSLAGDHNISYTISGLCGNDTTIKIHVDPVKDATITALMDTLKLCAFDPNPKFTVAQDGGSWVDNVNNPKLGVIQTATDVEFDLIVLGVGLENEMFIYDQGAPCGDRDTIWVTTAGKLNATITQVGPYCDSDGPVTLSVKDPGGAFSGTGIDPVTGVFKPKTAGVGIHTITYTITGNCGDVKTIDIEVLQTSDPTITNTTFDFCEDKGDELLTVAEAGGIWRELTPVSGGFTLGTSTFNTIDAGDGTFKIEYGFGGQCPALDTITLNITALPVITITAQDTLCADATAKQIIASATPSTSTTWGGAVNSFGMFDPVGKLGDNKMFFEAINGVCPAKDSLTVHVLPREDASIDPIPKQCVLSVPVILVSTSGNTKGVWLGNGVAAGFFDPSKAGVGTHTITHKINGRCNDTKTIDIEVVGAPDPSIITPNVVCAGSQIVSFDAVTPGGVWSGDVVSGEFNPILDGTFEAIYTINGICKVADTIPFVVNTTPKTDFSVAPRSGCVPLIVTFNDISDEIPNSSIWDFGSIGTSNALATEVVTFNEDGCYDITLSNVYTNGCKGSKKIVNAVCAYDIPDVDFDWNPNPANVDNSLITFNNMSSYDVVSNTWDFTNVVLPSNSEPITSASPATSNAVNPIVNFTSSNGDTISVCLEVVNQNGCINDTCKLVTILDKFSVIVPNAFTPNGDEVNDTFFPKGRNLYFGENYEFRIYNRWGSLIWISNIPGEGWDGTVTELAPTSGEIAQIDVYVWRLVVNDPFTGAKQESVGHVSLVK